MAGWGRRRQSNLERDRQKYTARVGLTGFYGKNAEENRRRRRLLPLQMQVCNKQCRHDTR